MWALCDIDHTIFESSWRDGIAPRVKEDSWDPYNEAGQHDPPIPEMIAVIQSMAMAGFSICGLTAIGEKWRQPVTKRLIDNHVPFELLLMRPDGDFRRAPQLKLDLATEKIGLANVGLIVDDREDVVAIFREAGITAMRVYSRRIPRDA